MVPVPLVHRPEMSNVVQSDLRCGGRRVGVACVSVDAFAARRGGLGYDEARYNPNYPTGSYSPSYSTGGYRHPGYAIKFSCPSGYSAGSGVRVPKRAGR